MCVCVCVCVCVLHVLDQNKIPCSVSFVRKTKPNDNCLRMDVKGFLNFYTEACANRPQAMVDDLVMLSIGPNYKIYPSYIAFWRQVAAPTLSKLKEMGAFSHLSESKISELLTHYTGDILKVINAIPTKKQIQANVKIKLKPTIVFLL